MSKRCANEEEDTSSSKMTRRESIDEGEDERHNVRMVEWESVQNVVNSTLDAKYGGMISVVDVHESYSAHKLDLSNKGYLFGTYSCDRSLFEALDRQVFCETSSTFMGRAVFEQAKGILDDINEGAKPQKNRFKRLVMLRTEYIIPVANTVLLLSDKRATLEDLDLFWELTDRLWCVAHPVYSFHSGHLDETCDKITKRLQALQTNA